MSLFRSVSGDKCGFYRSLIFGLPLLSRGLEAFYHPRTGEMGLRFRVRMDQLRILWDDAGAVIHRRRPLVPRVHHEVERLR